MGNFGKMRFSEKNISCRPLEKGGLDHRNHHVARPVECARDANGDVVGRAAKAISHLSGAVQQSASHVL